MANVNDAQADAQIRHATYLMRYRGGAVNRMLAVLERADEAAIGRLITRLKRIQDRGVDIGPATTRRIERVIVSIQNTRASLIASAGKDLTDDLGELLAYELTWQTSLVEGAVTTIGLEVTAPTVVRARAAAFSRPFQGRLLRDWLKDLNASDARRVRQSIQTGIIEGLTTPQITASVQSAMDTTRRHATVITRTAVTHTANAARTELALVNSDIIKAVQYLATLDSRTTLRCAALDKKVFPVNSGPRPAQHHQCRSTTTFVLKGAPGTTGTRASFNGQVAGDIDYDAFLRNQSRDYVEDFLGKTRADYFLRGKVKLDRFTDKSGRTYTLAELRKRDPDGFKQATVR